MGEMTNLGTVEVVLEDGQVAVYPESLPLECFECCGRGWVYHCVEVTEFLSGRTTWRWTGQADTCSRCLGSGEEQV